MAIRATAAFGAVTYPLFFGYVRSWADGWALHAPRDGDAHMTVTAVDVWGKLAGAKGPEVTPVGAGDTFGGRVARLLTAAGFVGGMDLDTGIITCQSTDMGDEYITEINKVAQSEGGAVFPGPDGVIHACGRYSLLEDLRSITVQAAFGDGPGEIPWAGIDTAPLSDETVINDAIYKRVGGTDQRYTDAISVALYGTRSDSETTDNLVCQTDGQVSALAQWAVLTGRFPEPRVDGLMFRPRCDLVGLAPLFLGMAPRDLVTVTLRPPSATSHVMTRSCFITGINHVFEQNDWIVRVVTASATTHTQLGSSRWDQGLWGASDVDPTGAVWFV